MKVLVVDVGGTNVKMLATGQEEPRKFPSGPTLTATTVVAGSRIWPGIGNIKLSRLAIPVRSSTIGL